jgi:hypothetical protein
MTKVLNARPATISLTRVVTWPNCVNFSDWTEGLPAGSLVCSTSPEMEEWRGFLRATRVRNSAANAIYAVIAAEKTSQPSAYQMNCGTMLLTQLEHDATKHDLSTLVGAS